MMDAGVTSSEPAKRARLAIVIPAYKASFLPLALESIASQTSREFSVYVGDDASPHDLESICRRFAGRMDLHYTRFDKNLGQVDLVAHWTRCVALSSEPWVWLFSDDDIMEPECVATVLAAISLDAGAYDLYHFDVLEIDSNGAVVRETPPYAEVTPSLTFALARTRYTLDSFAPDYVFARSALNDVGGFQSFPLAWCSDDATWIKLGRRSGIRAVRGPKVRWRQSGQNITSQQPVLAERKLAAASQYVGWLSQYLSQNPPRLGELDADELRKAALVWLCRHSRYLKASFWPRIGFTAGWHLRSALPFGALGGWAQTAYWDLRLKLRGW